MSNPIEQEYPLHYYIWTNDFKKLKNVLTSPLGQVSLFGSIGLCFETFDHPSIYDLKNIDLMTNGINTTTKKRLSSLQKLVEKRDIRGRTPLMLSVSLGHFECAKLLMNSNANVNIDDDHGFNDMKAILAV